jgi:hypothetical protein
MDTCASDDFRYTECTECIVRLPDSPRLRHTDLCCNPDSSIFTSIPIPIPIPRLAIIHTVAEARPVARVRNWGISSAICTGAIVLADMHTVIAVSTDDRWAHSVRRDAPRGLLLDMVYILYIYMLLA